MPDQAIHNAVHDPNQDRMAVPFVSGGAILLTCDI